MAKKSANPDINLGKISPRTIDLGFRKNLILLDTSWTSNTGRGESKVDGMSDGSRGWNSLEIALKWSAKRLATSSSLLPGKRDLGSNCKGRSFDW